MGIGLGGLAGIGIGGDLLGTALGGYFNASEAHKNRAFQARMSNTAYQRAADDMEKAGLNRVLALGSPASTPSGASASIQAPKLGSTGIAAATAKQSIAQSQAQEALYKEQARLTNAEADKAEVTKMLYDKLGPQAEKLVDQMIEFFSGSAAKGNPVKNAVESIEAQIEEGINSGKKAAQSFRDRSSMAIGDFVDNVLNFMRESKRKQLERLK